MAGSFALRDFLDPKSGENLGSFSMTSRLGGPKVVIDASFSVTSANAWLPTGTESEDPRPARSHAMIKCSG